MKVGINYAWKNYAWDFGEPPEKDSGKLWGGRAAWKASLADDLARFVELGLFCVRWFILGDGTTYGIGEQRPRPDAHGGTHWRFDDPPPLSDAFLEDFSALLSTCAQAGIQILPSLIDFHFCFPGIPVESSPGIVKCGRSDVVIDPFKREQFFDRALKPMLEIAAEFRNTVYAIELMNEPEWCTLGEHMTGSSPDLSNPKKTVPRDDMRAFLREGAHLINEAGFRSTVGFAHYGTLREWDARSLDLTLYQYHYYGEPEVVPKHDYDPRWPLIVGEIATAAHKPWPDLGAAQDLLSRLRHLERRGYPAAFLWSANRDEEGREDPSVVDFSEENLALLRRYTRGA